MAAEQVYSLIYYLMFVFALAIGLAALSMNPWGRANKHFYVLCMGIAAWTFGYAISNIAVDIDMGLFFGVNYLLLAALWFTLFFYIWCL